MNRAFLSVTTALAMMLAGCTGGNNTDNGTADGMDGMDHMDHHIPNATASFSSDVANGEIPVVVTFTMAFIDVQDTPVTWTIDADGDGTADANGVASADGSETYSHTYATEGKFIATATAVAGENDHPVLVGSSTITVTAVKGGVEQHEDASSAVAAESCANPSAYQQSGSVPEPGQDVPSRVKFTLLNETAGNTWESVFTFDVGSIAIYAFFTDGDGTIVDSSSDATPSQETSKTLAGTVPDGASLIFLYACGGPTPYTADYNSIPA